LVGVWGACRFAYTAFKAFLHGTALLLQNVGSYLLGRAYFHLVRPCAEFTAKFVLRFVQAAGHLFLAGGQCIYGIVKVAWHFAIRPLVTGAKWVAENLAKLLKMVWNKALLPGLYKCVWTPLKFLTIKFLLFAAAVVQVPFYLLALGLGGLVIGAGFGLSEASLWVKSHWISKAFYPIPYSAWRRTCEYNHLAGVREPLLKATEVRRYDRETAFSPT